MLHITRVVQIFPIWKQNAQCWCTIKSGNCPVAANAGRERRQLEDKGTHIWVGVSIRGCDVDPGVGTRTLTHLGLPGYEHGCIVIHIDQIDLKGSCPTGLRRAWGEARGKRGGERDQKTRRWDNNKATERGVNGDEAERVKIKWMEMEHKAGRESWDTVWR